MSVPYLCSHSVERIGDAQRHYRNASKLNSTNHEPMTGLLKAQLAEYERKEMEATDSNGSAAIRSAMEKIYVEIDNLEEFNRTTGLSQVGQPTHSNDVLPDLALIGCDRTGSRWFCRICSISA